MNKISSSFHFGHWFEMTSSSSFFTTLPRTDVGFRVLTSANRVLDNFPRFYASPYWCRVSGLSYSRENVFSTIFRDRKRIGIGGIRTADLPNTEPRLYLSTTVFPSKRWIYTKKRNRLIIDKIDLFKKISFETWWVAFLYSEATANDNKRPTTKKYFGPKNELGTKL